MSLTFAACGKDGKDKFEIERPELGLASVTAGWELVSELAMKYSQITFPAPHFGNIHKFTIFQKYSQSAFLTAPHHSTNNYYHYH